MIYNSTRVFMNGNSQAVRIPREFRFDTDEVEIFRNERGDIVLRAVRPKRGAALLAALHAFEGVDSAFLAALEAESATPQPMQERDAL